MEVAGLSLGVVAEARTLATSIITRISCFKKVPKRLAAIGACVPRIIGNADDIHFIGTRNGTSFPKDIIPLFNSTMCNVRENLFNMKTIERDAKYAAAELQHVLGQQTSILVGQNTDISVLSGLYLATLSSSSVPPPVFPSSLTPISSKLTGPQLPTDCITPAAAVLVPQITVIVLGTLTRFLAARVAQIAVIFLCDMNGFLAARVLQIAFIVRGTRKRLLETRHLLGSSNTAGTQRTVSTLNTAAFG